MEDSRHRPEDHTSILKSVSNADLERRIAKLEESIPKIENSHLERHTKFITIIFGCMTAFIAFCGIMLTVLAALSKSDTREATKDMQAQVVKATDDMEKKFAALSGEALKKPELQVTCQNGPLDGHLFEIPTQHPNPVDLGALFLKNTGTKRTETLSIRLYSSENVNMFSSGVWEPVASNDANYHYSWYLNSSSVSVDKGETWTFDRTMSFQLMNGATTNLNFRMLIFYGGENPAEAEFAVKFK